MRKDLSHEERRDETRSLHGPAPDTEARVHTKAHMAQTKTQGHRQRRRGAWGHVRMAGRGRRLLHPQHCDEKAESYQRLRASVFVEAKAQGNSGRHKQE